MTFPPRAIFEMRWKGATAEIEGPSPKGRAIATLCVSAPCAAVTAFPRERAVAPLIISFMDIIKKYHSIVLARPVSFFFFFLFRHHFAVTAQPTVVVRSPVNCLVHVDWEKQTSPLMRMIISRTGPRIDGFTARLLDDEALLRVTSQR